MMRTLNMRKRGLKFILALAVFALLISPRVRAQGDPPPAVEPSAMGGAFSSLMSESFQTDLATGAATLNIPIVVPPGRKNVQPNIALSYSSNNPNGICGVGWSIPVSAIQHSTKNGVPRYGQMDNFVAGGQELVDVGADGYRAKIESSFTKYIYSETDKNWIAYDKSGTKYYFGTDINSRMTHPTITDYIFAWYLDRVEDVYGNAMTYEYIKDRDSLYPKNIYYTSNDKNTPELKADKRIEFNYSFNVRPDNIYSNRSGWPSAITGRLDSIKIYLNEDSDWETDPGVRIWSYILSYEESPDTSRSLLTSIQLTDADNNVLPPKTFQYQRLEP
jgi:hypothetical protein